MNSGSAGHPGRLRRLEAITSIVLIVAVAVGTLVRVVEDPPRALAEVLLLAMLVGAGWVALTRAGLLSLPRHADSG